MKRSNLFVSLILAYLVFQLASCEKENVVNDSNDGRELGNPFDSLSINSSEEDSVILNTFFIVDFLGSENYFNADSLVCIEVETDIYNNLGVGINSITRERKLSLFNPDQALESIAELSVDELFMKRAVVSWDRKVVDRLTDSILSVALEPDSYYSKNVNTSSYRSEGFSMIYINGIEIKKFGEIKLNKENPDINEYLTYKTSLAEGFEQDEIPITPGLFKNIYGDKFVNSIVLGVLVLFEAEIIGVDCNEEFKGNALVEAMGLLKKAKEDNISWNEVKQNSVYFKNSDIAVSSKSGIPSVDFRLSVEELLSEPNSNDIMYQDKHFGVLSFEHLPYNTIYPKYNFE